MATDSKLQKHLRGNTAFVSEKQFLDQGFIVFVDDCRLFMCSAPLLHSLSILESVRVEV